MNNNSRLGNSLRNSSNSMIAQVLSILFNFVSRTVFIRLLNADYLGINGLFTDILTILSLAEMGVGSAIMYMMYKPIADGNKKIIAGYVNLYKKVYNYIGCFILFTGLLLTPFLHSFIHDVPNISENIQLIYVLFLLNTSVSYFFTYKRSLITAFQLEYINSRNEILFAVIKDIFQITILYLFRNYYFYLIVQVLTTLCSNIVISIKADKLFPEIKKYKKERISKSETKIIAKNTLAMMSHKIGSVIVSGTDSILISTFVGIGAVGLYSNYKMISTYLRQIINRGISSLTASFGNLIATSDNEKVYYIYRRMYFINMLLSYFMGLAFFGIANSFVVLWIGEQYVIDYRILFIITINLYLNQIRQASIITINTYGLFWNIKWKSIIEAIINLISSIILASYCKLGLLGVLLGTFISNISTNIWWEPLVAFRDGMKKSVIPHYVRLFKDSIIFLSGLFILWGINSHFLSMIACGKITKFIISGFITLIVETLLFIPFYFRMEEFMYSYSIIQKIIMKKIKKQ